MNRISSRPVRAAAALLAISLLGTALPAQADTVVKKPELTITVPKGWVEAPPKAMDAFNANVASAMAKLPKARIPQFQYGFQPAKQSHWFAGYPYFVVRVQTAGRIPEKVLAQMDHLDMNKMLKPAASKVPLLRKLNMGKPVYDPSTHTIWMSGDLPGINGVMVRGLSAIFATKNGFTQVSAYAPKAKFSSYYSMFHRIMASTVIPPALRY